jgi:hypothetical protein
MAVFFKKLLLDFKHLKNFYFLTINFFFNILSNIFLKNNNKNYDFFLDNFNKYKFSANLYDSIFKKNFIVDFI